MGNEGMVDEQTGSKSCGRMGGRVAGAAGGSKARRGSAIIILTTGLGSDTSHKVVAHTSEC